MNCERSWEKAICQRSRTKNGKFEARAEKALSDLYANLTPWQKTLVARAQGRPRFGDYVKGLITEFTPLAGRPLLRRRRSDRRRPWAGSRASRSAS